MKKNFGFGVAQALALGMCVGLVLSSASCGTKPPTKQCNSRTCETGCCDDTTGQCFGANDAGVQANDACGLGGTTCTACMGNTVCVSGSCRLGSGGGSGGGGGSTGGGGGSTGGSGGGSTTLPDGGMCNATNCPGGCCSPTAGCLAPAMQNFTKCGVGGAVCSGCPQGQDCLPRDGGSGNACQTRAACSACLDTQGKCRDMDNTMTNNNYCGANGGICARCDTNNNQSCMGGRCISTATNCNSTNCDGCCAGNTCIRPDGGTSNAQCGIGGAVCTTCTTPATCNTAMGTCVGGGGTGGGGGGFPGLDGGIFPTCDVTTCPTGCCSIISGCVTIGGADPSGLGTACGMPGDVCSLCAVFPPFIPDCAAALAAGVCL